MLAASETPARHMSALGRVLPSVRSLIRCQGNNKRLEDRPVNVVAHATDKFMDIVRDGYDVAIRGHSEPLRE